MMEKNANTVVVMVLSDRATAEKAALDVRAAATEGRFDVADVVVATHDDGKVQIHHMTPNGPITSFIGGALLGGLAGVVLGAVLVPALAVGSVAAIVTDLSERSIPKEAMESIGAALRDGKAALFVLTDPSSARIIQGETEANSDLTVYGLHPADSQAVAAAADDIARELAGA